jgi:hypothetical protein
VLRGVSKYYYETFIDIFAFRLNSDRNNKLFMRRSKYNVISSSNFLRSSMLVYVTDEPKPKKRFSYCE